MCVWKGWGQCRGSGEGMEGVRNGKGIGESWEEVGEAVRSWRDHSSNLYIPDTLCFFLYTNRYTPKKQKQQTATKEEGGERRRIQ